MRRATSSSLHRAIALVVVLAYLPACTEWRPLPGPQPAQRLSGEHDLLITLKDGTRVTLLKARVTGDSLVGQASQGGSRYRKIRRAVALSDIRELADRQYSEGKSAAAMAGGMLGAGVLALVALGIYVNQSMSFEIGCPPPGCTR
ncbi:MAG TPA: hypothetical protein VIP80_15525 [Gemmatimonadales bacterium]